eukprot:gene22766-31056_t
MIDQPLICCMALVSELSQYSAPACTQIAATHSSFAVAVTLPLVSTTSHHPAPVPPNPTTSHSSSRSSVSSSVVPYPAPVILYQQFIPPGWSWVRGEDQTLAPGGWVGKNKNCRLEHRMALLAPAGWLVAGGELYAGRGGDTAAANSGYWQQHMSCPHPAPSQQWSQYYEAVELIGRKRTRRQGANILPTTTKTDSAIKKRQRPVSSCYAFGKAPSSACKSCDECQKLKVLLSEREKQLSIQQQQLKASETMAEEVTALARRCKAYEQKARRLTVATQGLATKQLGMQALSSSLSGSVDDSCLQKRSATSRLNRRNLEEKIDKLEASYDLQGELDENFENNKENQSNIHKRHQSLNINILGSNNGSNSMDDTTGDPSLSVKDRILKKKMMNSAALQPESITSASDAAARQTKPRERTKSGVSWGPVEVNDAAPAASPDIPHNSSSVINDLTQEFIAAATIEEGSSSNPSTNPNPTVVTNEEQKARPAPTTELYTTKSGKKSVKARLLELLSGMDCSDEERFDKMRLILEIRAFQPKA